MKKHTLLLGLLVLLLVMVAVNAGADWEMKYKGETRYYIVNYTNSWILCEAIGTRYYYKEFEVAPGRSSRTYRLPEESFDVTCEKE